jgi:hypothetical protein
MAMMKFSLGDRLPGFAKKPTMSSTGAGRMLRPRLDGETMDSSHLVGDEPNGIWRDQRDPLQPHLLYIGGEDHHLRIPAMCALRDHGFRITAVGSGNPAPFVHAGIRYRGFKFDRFVNPRADLASIKSLAKILVEEQPDLAPSHRYTCHWLREALPAYWPFARSMDALSSTRLALPSP